jgi:hypothetical protein
MAVMALVQWRWLHQPLSGLFKGVSLTLLAELSPTK